jgi:hypothetical protein
VKTGGGSGNRGGKDWTEKVYKPDIQDKWDKLYKKPGYNPFE